jgi:large subunit ribosomal protein L17
MRHRVAGRKLGRTREHRLALRRNLVASLIEHETISTTIQKAKEVKALAEKVINLAKKGTLQSRRQAIALIGTNRRIVAHEEGEVVDKGTVVGKLFSDIGPRYLERSGGYTRIIRMPLRRLGDNGELALLQLVGKEDRRKKVKGRKKGPKTPRKTKAPKKKTSDQTADKPTDRGEASAESSDKS